MKTIQELIRIVQDRISLPLDDDDRWSTTAVVNAFNDALDDKLTPDLVSEGTNYLVQREVFPLRNGSTAIYPLNSIPIPTRAVGRVLREVKYLPTGATSAEDEINCLVISIEDKDKFSKDPAFYSSAVPYIYVENDSLRLIGGSGFGSIVMYYSLEPSVLEYTTGKYSTISGMAVTSPFTITVETESSVWTSFFSTVVDTRKYVDIYRKSTGAIIKANVRLKRKTANTYEPENLSANEIIQIKTYQSGNFTDGAAENELLILPAAKSEFSTIPYEYDQLLALYVCERILESLGDTEGLQVTMGKIKETKESISRLGQNRIQGETRLLEDRRSVANAEPRSIQSMLLDLFDKLPVQITDDARWTTAALVRAFNAVLVDKLAPDIVGEGSNYLIQRQVIPLTVNNTPAYPLNSIPINKRAVGRALREVKYLPAGRTKIEEEMNCPAISLEEKDMYSGDSDVYGSSVPYIFVENDSLRLVGGDLKGSIVVYYSLEPSTLTATVGRYAKIQGWTTNSLTIDNAPPGGTAWDTYIPAGSSKIVDIFCKATGAVLKANVKVTRNAVTNEYIINNLSVDEVTQIKVYQTGGYPAVGDIVDYSPEVYLVPAGECEFVTIPEEYDQLLVLYACERIQEAMGDANGMAATAVRIRETRDSILRVTGNRLQGERRKLTDRRSIARIQRGQKWTRNYNKNFK